MAHRTGRNHLQVAEYLSRQEDVARLAPLFLKDEVDGAALLLLNLPSILRDLAKAKFIHAE